MAVRRTKAQLATIAAEAAADAVVEPPALKASARSRKVPSAIPTLAPVDDSQRAPAYRLTDFVGKTTDDVYSWTATAVLGKDACARVVWSGAKKTAVIQPLAKTTGADHEARRFEATARRLLPGKDSVTELVKVLIFTSEPGITAFNRVALLKDVSGSAEIAFDPGLIVPASD